jgi:DNA-binding MarR family transcriptional regulator
MNPTANTEPRVEQIEHIVRDLIPRASQLTRLALGQTRGEISRSEGGILRTLTGGPKRVTELAEIEGLAQPTTTVLLKQLERNGWVRRGPDPHDRRAVLVSLTPDGAGALESYRAQYRARLRDCVAGMPEEQITALENSIGALDALVIALQKEAAR